MKKWVNRTWAKAAAFALTLVFAALTALGALGIAVLVSRGVFLDGGDALSAALYDEQCHSAISQADTFLRGVLTDAGLLNESSDAADQPDGGTYFEGYYLDDAVIPNLFAQHFPRESFPCRLAVIDTNSGEVVFDNFSVNSGETILRSLEETFVYGLTTDATLYLTISAYLLEPMAPSSYAALMAAWLLEHTGLAVFLTALFGLLALFCFCFSMASAGHWPGREGIHLTWLDKIPADLWAAVLVCAFSAGWDAFYMEWGRIWFCVAMIPFVLLFLCVFAAQCKAGTIIRGTVIARVLRLLWRVLRGLGVWLWHIGRGLPLVWKTALVGLVIAGGEFLLYVNDFYLVRYNIFLALKIVELLALLAVALNLRTLEKSGQRLAEGDLTTPADTRRLFGAFRRYGQAMNRLQSGMENAVQEQMRAERMKTELITNVSHDIKTPLTSIISYVELLKREPDLPPHVMDYIKTISQKADRLNHIVQDVFEVSKAATGNISLDLEDLDIGKLLQQTFGEMEEDLRQSTLAWRVDIPDTPMLVHADGQRLYRVFQNLIRNCDQYALEGSRVYVNLTAQPNPAGGGLATVMIRNISRNEITMDADHLTARFVRGDQNRTTEGSGLGLSIAKSFTEACGGRFNVHTDGDLFIVTVQFPLVVKAPVAPPAPAATAVPQEETPPAEAHPVEEAPPPPRQEPPVE